jgi:hypothetical protein
LVFGDSVAQVTAWSLTNSSAAGEGRIEVISMGVGACPLVGDSYRWDRTSNGKWTKYCDIDAVLAAIAKYQPDAVLAVFTLANQADVRIAGTWTSLDDPVMRAVMLSRMEDVAEAVNEADSVLLWSSAPRGVDVRELFAMADRRVAVHNQMVDEFLRTHPAVSRFPLAEQYAELDAGAFRDGIHLDKAAAVAQAEDWQVEHILAAIDERGSTSPGSDGTTDDR